MSASTTLDDIISELGLTYDPSVGLLDGDSLRDIPNLSVLHALNKLLGNLSRQLKEVESTDQAVLVQLKEQESSASGAEEAEAEESATEKREREDVEADDVAPKRHRPSSSGEENEQSEEKTEVPPQDEDEGAEVDDNEVIDEAEANGEVAKTKETIETVEGSVDPSATESDVVPPVQSGSFTQDNDTRLKNPKSEFVESQTLSAAAIAELGLYSEDNQGLETQGKAFLQKRYGVASYPENDLSDLLAGPIPDVDFSKSKPQNPTPFATFQTYVESYFKPFSSDDINLLQEGEVIPPGFEHSERGGNYDPNVSPYIIPKRRRFYADVWADEDPSLIPKLNSVPYQQPPVDSYKPRGTINDLTDDNLYTEDVSCGPLSSRLFSAILGSNEREDEDSEPPEILEEEEDDDASGARLENADEYRLTTDVSDFSSIEDRLKRELKHIGIFVNLPIEEEKKGSTIVAAPPIRKSIIDNDEWIKNKEDDEVCAEIRALQKELRSTVARNRANRKKLIPIVEEQIAYQEYSTILEDLDKQVDQAYMKRLKGKSKKKKVDVATPQQQAVNNGLRALLEKRRRWIDNIGRLFPVAEIMKRVPRESILVKPGDEVVEVIEEMSVEDELLK